MAKKEFSFDDTIEYDKKQIQPTPKKKTDSQKFQFEDQSKKSSKGKVKPTKKKRFKKWHIALAVIVALGIAFIAYIFIAGGGSGTPVYGERCAKLISVDTSKFTQIEKTIKDNNPSVNSVKIEKDCRTFKMTIVYADNVSSGDAKGIANGAVHTLDDTYGLPKEEGSAWSKLLGKDKGRGQYNVDLHLMSNGDADFPIFGTKQPTSEDISYTGNKPKNQETTNSVVQ